MPFNSQLQAKLDAAQARNDAAKKGWQLATEFWNTHFVALTCYKAEHYDVHAAATWFTPNDGPCSQGADCSHQDKVACKAEIELVRNNIGMIRNAYTELQAAQANYDQVFAEVTAAANADPQHQLDQLEIEANAAANKLKQWFWIILLILAAAGTFIYFKWFRK